MFREEKTPYRPHGDLLLRGDDEKNMIVSGIGIDIEKIERFRDIPYSDAFYRKFFSEQEIDYCMKTADPAPHFAVRFAAKEAMIKAWDGPIGYEKLEISIKENGAPYVRSIRGGTDVMISLSHNATEAVACAIVLRQ